MEHILLFIASCLLGISVAAPIGPINVEIIRRGLTIGGTAAFFLGLGAVSADCAYFTLGVVGTEMVRQIVDTPWIVRTILGIGGGFLLWMGAASLRKAWTLPRTELDFQNAENNRPVPRGSTNGAKPFPTYLLGLAMTLANPMTIAFWLSISASLAVSGETGPIWVRIGGVAVGAFSWVVFIVSVTVWTRRWVNDRFLRGVNLISGLMLVGFGLRFVVKIFTLEM